MSHLIPITSIQQGHPEHSLTSALPSPQIPIATYHGDFLRRTYEQAKVIVEIGQRTFYDGHRDFGRSSSSTEVSTDPRPAPLRLYSDQMPAQIPKGFFQRVYPIPAGALPETQAAQITRQLTLFQDFSIYEKGTRYEFALAPSLTGLALGDYECSTLKGTGENVSFLHSLESSSVSIPTLTTESLPGIRFDRWISGQYFEQLNTDPTTEQIVTQADGNRLKLTGGHFQRTYSSIQSVTDFPDPPASSAIPVPRPALSTVSPPPLAEGTQEIDFFSYTDLLQKRDRFFQGIASKKNSLITIDNLREWIKLDATLKKFPLALPLAPSPLPITLEADTEEGFDPITEEELDYLIQTFPNCRTIFLGSTDISDPSLLLTKLAQLKNLTRINFNECTFEESDLKHLQPVEISQLENLTISKSEEFGRILLSKIIQAPKLQTLLIVEQDNLTKDDFQNLSRFNQLANVEMRGCEVTAEELSYLPPSVTCLELQSCDLDTFPVNTNTKGSLPHLQKLILSYCSSLSLKLSSLLNSYPKLTYLSIDSTNIRNSQPYYPIYTFSNDSDSTWSYAFNTSSNTTLVYTPQTQPGDPWVFSSDVSNPTPVLTDQNLRNVHPQYNLETLQVCAGEDFTQEGFNRLLSVCPHLKELDLDQCPQVVFKESAPLTHVCLEKLTLTNHGLTDASSLRNLLYTMPYLHTLTLRESPCTLTKEICETVKKDFPTINIIFSKGC